MNVTDKRDLDTLTQTDWYNLLLKSPSLGVRCPCWEEFSGAQIGELLRENASLSGCVAVNELSSEKTTDMLIAAPELKGLVDLSKIDNDVDRMRLCAVCPGLSDVIQGSDKWRGVKGYIWRSLTGPVIVVPVFDLIKKFPEYPVSTCRRVGDYSVRRGVISYYRGGASSTEKMSYGDAQKIVDYLFTMFDRRAVAIDGVYVAEDGRNSADKFAEILKEWFREHITSIKLLYLEYGGHFNKLALADNSCDKS